MINPMQFWRSGDDVWASALRVAADLVEDGKGRSVDFLGQVTPVVLDGEREAILFFRLYDLATGERWYQAPGGTRI